MMAERGGRPLLLIDLAVPRDVEPACARAARRDARQRGLDARGRRAPPRWSAGPRRARPRASSRRRSRRSRAGSARSRCCRRSPPCASAADAIVDAGAWPRTRARWESASERDRERVEALARAVAKRLLHEPTLRVKQRRASTATRGCTLLRELFGLEERGGGRRGGAARRGPPAARLVDACGSAPAGARWRSRRRGWVAERLPGEVEIVTMHDAPATPTARAGDKSRWVGAIERALLAGEIDLAVHSAKDVPGELAPGTAIVAAPPRADPADVLVGEPRSALRGRAGGHERAAPARAAAGRRGRTSRSPSCAATSTRGCASWRDGRGGRARARRRPGWSGSAATRRAARSTRRCSSPPPGRARSRPGARRTTRGGRGGAGRRRRRWRSPAWTPSAPPCGCWRPPATRRWASTPTAGPCAGFVGRPDGSAWVLDERRRASTASELARRMLAAAPALRELLRA